MLVKAVVPTEQLGEFVYRPRAGFLMVAPPAPRADHAPARSAPRPLPENGSGSIAIDERASPMTQLAALHPLERRPKPASLVRGRGRLSNDGGHGERCLTAAVVLGLRPRATHNARCAVQRISIGRSSLLPATRRSDIP